MKPFIAIDHTHLEHHKYQGFDTLGEAQKHISSGNLPNGFAATNPGGNPRYWAVDMVAKTITVDTEAEAGAVLGEMREVLYNLADGEYLRRSLLAAEGVKPGNGKVRGGRAKDRLTALSIKANARGNNALRNVLAGVHDKLDALKDIIEASDQVALDSFDVTDGPYWA
ncbi:MAG: hypothetical protein KAR40_15365 [Candidatus Sabulitectum sp.]|nr:hypothetical protein [Candidatus Sabulitectum sp.]